MMMIQRSWGIVKKTFYRIEILHPDIYFDSLSSLFLEDEINQSQIDKNRRNHFGKEFSKEMKENKWSRIVFFRALN